MSPIPKKSANFAARALGACGAKFSLSKNHRSLKKIENLQIPSFYFKNNPPKENLKLKFFKYFFLVFLKKAKRFLV